MTCICGHDAADHQLVPVSDKAYEIHECDLCPCPGYCADEALAAVEAMGDKE